MSVFALSSFVLGAFALITPCKADLFCCLLAAVALARWFCDTAYGSRAEPRDVILERFSAILCVALSAHPIVDKVPNPFVAPDKVGVRAVVP